MSIAEDPEQSRIVATTTRTSRIIIAALLAGLLVLIGVAVINAAKPPQNAPQGQAPADQGPPLITYVALALAATTVPFSLILPSLLATSARKRLAPCDPSGDIAALASVFQMCLIVSAALVETAGNMAAIAYLLEHHPAALGVALGLWFVIATWFPLGGAVERWVENQRDKLNQERELGS